MSPRASVAPLVALASVLVASTASAHVPLFADAPHADAAHALALPDADVARVVYAERACPSRPIFVSFPARAGERIAFELGVPAIESLAAYRPTLALVGPGLPHADEIPYRVPEGDGIVAFPTAKVRTPEAFHEPYTGTDSWVLVKHEWALPTDGTYYLVAFDPEYRAGRLWLTLGQREEKISSIDPSVLDRVRAFFRPGESKLGDVCELVAVPPDEDPPTDAGGSGCATAPGSARGQGAAWIAIAIGLAAMRRARRR